MTRRKKIALWVAGVSGSVLLLMLIGLVALPRVIEQEQIKERIRSAISRRLEGEVSFATADASFFPPQATLSGLRSRLFGVHGTIQAVRANFKILPLFTGKLRTVKLRFNLENFDKIQGKLQTRAVYEKIPHPVEISATRFACSRESLVLEDLDIKSGKSHLEASSARLDWKDEMNLTVGSAAAAIYLDQSLPWTALMFSQIGELKDIAADYNKLRGILSFSSLDLQGPLKQPGLWQFSGKGAVEDLLVETDHLPAPLELERMEFKGSANRVKIELRKLALLGSSLSLSGEVGNPLAEAADVDVSIHGAITSKTAQWITGWFDLPAQVAAPTGGVNIDELVVQGPLFEPERFFFRGRGTVEKLVVKTKRLPDALIFDKGGFVINPEKLSLRDIQLDFLDASMTLSGSMQAYLEGFSSLDLKFSGSVGQKACDWLKDEGMVFSRAKLAAPVSVSKGHVVWVRKQRTVFAGDLTMQNGLRVGLDFVRDPQKWTIKKLNINDSTAQASMSMTLGDDIVDLDFEGQLADETVRKLIEDGSRDLHGWIRGDFNLRIPTRYPAQSRVQGTIQAGGFTFAIGLYAPVRIRELALQAEADRIRIDSADLQWRATDIDLKGNIELSSEGIQLDLVASTEWFDWEKINRVVEEEIQKTQRKPSERHSALDDLKPRGKVVLKANYFKYGDLTWKPFHLVMKLKDKRLGLQLTQGNLCGVGTTAAARLGPESMLIEAEADAQDKALEPTLECFLESKLMSGEFDLTGEVTTHTKAEIAETFLEELEGQFDFNAEDGRIFKFDLLAKILAVVNITEILKGQAPDLTNEGFGYKRAEASGVIENGVLKLDEAYVDGKSIDLAFNGSMDIPEKQIDLIVLVTPLKTVDSIIERIPIIGHILGENFIAIPVHVSGDPADPTVTPMSASAVGKGLLGILERTLKLPVKVVQPFTSE
jgi:hypothetical protein